MHVERFESALWQTASLLLVAGDEAVVIDPCISSEEVARIADRAATLGARVTHVLATHADWDHVCGIAAFPDAVATMGAATAEIVASGEPLAADPRGRRGVRPEDRRRAARRPGAGGRRRTSSRPVHRRDDSAPRPHRRRHRLPHPRARPPRGRRSPFERGVPVRVVDVGLPRDPGEPDRTAPPRPARTGRAGARPGAHRRGSPRDRGSRPRVSPHTPGGSRRGRERPRAGAGRGDGGPAATRGAGRPCRGSWRPTPKRSSRSSCPSDASSPGTSRVQHEAGLAALRLDLEPAAGELQAGGRDPTVVDRPLGGQADADGRVVDGVEGVDERVVVGPGDRACRPSRRRRSWHGRPG